VNEVRWRNRATAGLEAISIETAELVIEFRRASLATYGHLQLDGR